MKTKVPGFKYNRAMLLDDIEIDNFIHKKTLETTHFTRKTFVNTSSRSALESLNNMKVSNQDVFPEIIFIDINMPIIDGFQFIEKFRLNYPEKIDSTKLVILTSSICENDKLKAKNISEQIVFLNKPLTQEALSLL